MTNIEGGQNYRTDEGLSPTRAQWGGSFLIANDGAGLSAGQHLHLTLGQVPLDELENSFP